MTRVRAASVVELPPSTAKRVSLGGRVIALFNVGGEFYAVEDRCPHEGGRLSSGSVDDGAVRCPVHGACFALATGEALEPPAGEAMSPPVDQGIPVYRVSVINDEIYLDL